MAEQGERYEWLPSESADERYPMQLLSGQLEGGGESVELPAGKIMNRGWGELGSRRIVGEDLKVVPERLNIAWFSYTENTFFGGKLELPTLGELFRKGLREPEGRAQITWDKILVGMGLGGWLSVWVCAQGIVREVATATFDPIERDWSEVLDNPTLEREDFVRETLRGRLSDAAWRSYRERGVEDAASRWPRYNHSYRWQLVTEGVQVPLHAYVRSFNGERNFYELRQPPRGLERAPKRLDITWRGRRNRLLSRIEFDERELFGALSDLGAASSDGPVPRLRVEYLPRHRVEVALEGTTQRRVLSRARVDVSSLSSSSTTR